MLEAISWAAACALSSQQYGVRAALIMDLRGRATRATGDLLKARRAALYLTNVATNMPLRALCRATRMDHTTISRHLAAVEDDREMKSEFDSLVEEMTGRLQVGLARMLAELEGARAGVAIVAPAPVRRVAA